MRTRGVHVTMRALLAATLVAVAAPAPGRAAGEQVPRAVLSSGATHATAAGVQLTGTVGQLAVGASAATAIAAGHGYWSTVTVPLVDVGPDGGPRAAPVAIEFGAPMPNPSRASVAFDLALPRAGRVELRVLDLQGRLVAAPDTRSMPAGRHRLVFTPAGDAPLGPGVYFTRLLVDGRVAGVRRFVRVQTP